MGIKRPNLLLFPCFWKIFAALWLETGSTEANFKIAILVGVGGFRFVQIASSVKDWSEPKRIGTPGLERGSTNTREHSLLWSILIQWEFIPTLLFVPVEICWRLFSGNFSGTASLCKKWDRKVVKLFFYRTSAFQDKSSPSLSWLRLARWVRPAFLVLLLLYVE